MTVRRRVAIDFPPDEGLTRQEFKAECNINNIMAKYQKTGIIDHIMKYSPTYGEYSPIDFQEAMDTIKQGESLFAELPSKARKYFNNDPAEFMEFVNDPENIEKLVELGLAFKPVQTPETTDPVPTPAPEADSPV